MGVVGSVFVIILSLLIGAIYTITRSLKSDCNPQSIFCNDVFFIFLIFLGLPVAAILLIYLIMRSTWNKKVAFWTASILLIPLILGWLISIIGYLIQL